MVASFIPHPLCSYYLPCFEDKKHKIQADSKKRSSLNRLAPVESES